MIDISRDEEKSSLKSSSSSEESAIPGLIMFLPIGSFLAAIYYLYIQASVWIKTAEWHTIALHTSLVELKVIQPFFYFDLPSALGLEKLLNGLLLTSAPEFYFLASVILFFICIPIAIALTANE